MSTRIYSESVKKWAKIVGVSAASLGTLLFAYLIINGLIIVDGYSADEVCEGTVENPCYIYINFTPTEDIFIYPIDYDPWGRSESFEFDPNVKSWELQRSWGNSWRTIPLYKSCTGTWCGLSNIDDKRKFSVVFREGKHYKVRLVVLKHKPYQNIKWSAFDGSIDPYLYGTNVKLVKGVKYEKLCDETFKETKQTLVYDCEKEVSVYGNVTRINETTQKEYVSDGEIVGTKIVTSICTKTIKFNESVKCEITGKITKNDVLINEPYYTCKLYDTGVVCDQNKDKFGGGGDGNGDGICQAGESCKWY